MLLLTKPTPLRKVGGIVRFWEEWCGNPSGSRPNFFGRQHITFDKGGIDVVLSERWYSNPSVLTAKSLQYKKSGHIASRTQQSNSLCRAVKPPPFDKGGKRDGAGQGIVGFWNGW